MAKAKGPADQPDALVHSDDGQEWSVFCTLCTRELGGVRTHRDLAHRFAREHLGVSHGLRRIWVDEHRPGYREAVQTALELALPHHRTLTTDHRAS